MAKRRSRRRKRSNGVSWLMMVAMGLLIAGFLARRLMMPPAARYLAHQTEDSPGPAPQSDASEPSHAPAAPANDGRPGEHLSDSDRRALDEVIRRKTASH